VKGRKGWPWRYCWLPAWGEKCAHCRVVNEPCSLTLGDGTDGSEPTFSMWGVADDEDDDIVHPFNGCGVVLTLRCSLNLPTTSLPYPSNSYPLLSPAG
jgi:hypothetical protein